MVALQIICRAVERYKDLCEGKFCGAYGAEGHRAWCFVSPTVLQKQLENSPLIAPPSLSHTQVTAWIACSGSAAWSFTTSPPPAKPCLMQPRSELMPSGEIPQHPVFHAIAAC